MASTSAARPDHYFQSNESSYWVDYLSARPDYTADFYSIIFNHHGQRGSNQWRLAHDVACGPGNVTQELAARFKHVVASDISPDHIAAARERQPEHKEKISFEVGRVEGLAELANAGEWVNQTDMILMGECALMDNEASLKSFSTLLASGGTFATWFYGRPIFVNADGASINDDAQKIFTDLISFMFQNVGNIKDPQFIKATRTMHTWFEDMQFDKGTWRDVRRMYWNSDQPLCFYRPDICTGSNPEDASPVPSDEKVDRVSDKTFWAREWDIKKARNFVMALTPFFTGALQQKPQVKEQVDAMFDKLENAMGGPGSKSKVTWPVTLVMAIKQ